MYNRSRIQVGTLLCKQILNFPKAINEQRNYNSAHIMHIIGNLQEHPCRSLQSSDSKTHWYNIMVNNNVHL